jgi:DNA gyrase subunit A
LLFTSKGRVYWIKVYELPEAAAATRGKAISSLVKFQEDEKLTALVAARNLEEAGQFVFMATRNGTVKKSALTEFSNPRSTGIIAITLDGKDELIGAKLTDGKKMIFLASHEGQAILFRETEVRPMGRGAGGVNGMDLDKEDYVVSMDAVQPAFDIIAKEHNQTSQNLEELENEHIKDSLTTLMLTVAEKGFGKRTPLSEYRITSRGGKGVVNMKTTDRNGSVVATLQVTEESDVMIITHNGKVIRVHANEIREAGRSTQGVRLLRLDDDDSVAAAAVLQEENDEEKSK